MILINSITLFLFGFLSIVLYGYDIYLPVELSVLVLFLATVYLVRCYRNGIVGLLLILIWVTYALPFIHIIPYIWFDYSSQPIVLWGLAVNPYMLDEKVIQLTGMLGAVGAIGICLGVSLHKRSTFSQLRCYSNQFKKHRITMSLPIWLVWIVFGVILSWLYAPSQSILNYGIGSVSLLAGANFGSAWMMSYVIVSFASIDAIMEPEAGMRRFKLVVSSLSILFIVLYLQLLRGDRESIPWVFSLILAYYYWGAPVAQQSQFKISWIKIASVAFILIASSLVLGAIRSRVLGLNIYEITTLVLQLNREGVLGFSNITHGTWSASLLTPLSIAGDHIHESIRLSYGQDYLSLLLSIPPGFIADAMGFVRPIDALSGPAWDMRYGIGGTHAVVVPFLNFRMVGVFLIPAIWSYIMTSCEKYAMARLAVIPIALLVSLAMAAPHWLWYGEKYAMNAVILWAILAFFYRVSLSMFRRNSETVHIGLKISRSNDGVLV